ncbi:MULTISPECIES: hypothetical protein, partial [Erysipelotrichaceae]|uniref:hypothetical protein n=1 Tax=Erysipelotrichaceae TaxID=128827 RepID=UPI0025B73ED3
CYDLLIYPNHLRPSKYIIYLGIVQLFFQNHGASSSTKIDLHCHTQSPGRRAFQPKSETVLRLSGSKKKITDSKKYETKTAAVNPGFL